MSALDHHTWSYIQNFSIAIWAVVIPSFTSRGFLVILYAIWVKTGKTIEFPSETTAIVAACEDFLAGIVHQVDAVSGAANLLEGRHHRRWRLCELAHAISAFFHFFVFFMLLASLSYVIRLSSTLRVCAVCFPTRIYRATNSVLRHAFSWLFCDWFIIIVPKI